MLVNDVIAAIPSCDVPVEDLIADLIRTTPDVQKVKILLALSQSAADLDEKLLYFTYAAYTRLTAQNLHLHHFQSTAELHQAIDFAETVGPKLEQYQELIA